MDRCCRLLDEAGDIAVLDRARGKERGGGALRLGKGNSSCQLNDFGDVGPIPVRFTERRAKRRGLARSGDPVRRSAVIKVAPDSGCAACLRFFFFLSLSLSLSHFPLCKGRGASLSQSWDAEDRLHNGAPTRARLRFWCGAALFWLLTGRESREKMGRLFFTRYFSPRNQTQPGEEVACRVRVKVCSLFNKKRRHRTLKQVLEGVRTTRKLPFDRAPVPVRRQRHMPADPIMIGFARWLSSVPWPADD